MGRPDPARRSRVRLRQSDSRGAGRAVRLQQRLRRSDPGRRRRRSPLPGRQPGVSDRALHVRRLQGRRTHRAAGPHRHGVGRHRSRRGHRAIRQRRPQNRCGPSQPTSDCLESVPSHRPGRGQRVRQDGRRPGGHHCPGHLRQLFRRSHPVGHDALRGGELQQLLREPEHRHRRQGQGAARALLLRGRRRRALLGTVRQALRPGRRAERGESLRLHRRGGSARPEFCSGEAQFDGPVQARIGEHLRGRERAGQGHRRRLQR